jgi:c-di-GMP-binding flagellar brake protein YcgR
MFGALRKVFIHDTGQSDTAVSKSNPNIVEEPRKILKLLQQIIESPPLCTVTIPNANRTFFTSILGIEKEKNRLIFDQLTPLSGNSLLSQCPVIKVSSFVNGINLSFHLKEITQVASPEQPNYQALIPETIYYPQRRASPRIETDSTAISFHGTSKDTGLLIKGYVLDLSRTGLCVALVKNGTTLVSGEKLADCVIHLPDGSPFTFDLSVRSVRKSSPGNPQKQFGGFYTSVTVRNQNKLDRYICALERRQIRKRKN